MDLKSRIIDLYRKAATELPADVVDALKGAYEQETDPTPKEVLATILENLSLAKGEAIPICQDTGTPLFYVKDDGSIPRGELRKIIEAATETATAEVPLRPNGVDIITGKNIGNRPIIHFEEADRFGIDLFLKGGGSENVSAVYAIPSTEINADRSLDGARTCVLDCMVKAQGRGCSPYVVGVAVAGGIEEVAHLSKKQLLRKISDVNPVPELRSFEERTLKEINQLGIGPLGLGGRSTALAVKAAVAPRHPACFFVGVSVGCWALRRHSL
ncbi:MAG: fumarate hydratase [Phycisphaerae bacterium]|jgi:fumarate hydratase class I